MKRLVTIAILAAALLTAMLPGVGQANPSTGLGIVQFGCQIKLTFPATNAVPKTNCDGWANGAFGAAATKPGAVLFAGVPNKLPLGLSGKCQPGCYVNLRVDNIVYNEPCAANGEPPVIGTATGTTGIQGAYALGGGPAFIRAAFSYTRVGVLFVATLTNVGGSNGTDTKNAAATGSGIGAVAGYFVPKLLTETLGVCGAPQQNNIDIYGVADIIAL